MTFGVKAQGPKCRQAELNKHLNRPISKNKQGRLMNAIHFDLYIAKRLSWVTRHSRSRSRCMGATFNTVRLLRLYLPWLMRVGSPLWLSGKTHNDNLAAFQQPWGTPLGEGTCGCDGSWCSAPHAHPCAILTHKQSTHAPPSRPFKHQNKPSELGKTL